jgi:hypothetical protein
VELNSGVGEAVAAGVAGSDATAVGNGEIDGGGGDPGSPLSFPGATPPQDASDHTKPRPMTPSRVSRPAIGRFRNDRRSDPGCRSDRLMIHTLHRRSPPAWYRNDLATTKKPASLGRFRAWKVEATTGFEPVNRGFADLRVEPLHHVALCDGRTRRDDRFGCGCPSRIRTSVHGSKVRCPTTRRRGSGR